MMYERVTKACELMLNTIDFVHEMNFFLFSPPLFTCLRPLLGFFSKYNLFTRFDRTKPLTIHEKKTSTISQQNHFELFYFR